MMVMMKMMRSWVGKLIKKRFLGRKVLREEKWKELKGREEE